eukprot:TRINITY_DN1513_c1_g1_i23.p1 TRINITY_DN1513_c1_g1~~TRINITY_DN1513_c1_g1_i23.p1  ORF type:complete len:1142 (-),score=395.94 TRINITY_DN1513_c1_g1_i23:359-3784(-)
MYSPSSSPSRKGPFGSAKGSPRKNLLSPSDVTPFSFNGPDGLGIFGSELLSQTNGIIPMSLPSDHRRLSRTTSVNLNNLGSTPIRPRTQSLIPLGKSHSVGSSGGMQQRIRPTGSAGAGEGSYSSSGRSVKEYDNTLRDLQRDNFNLKLRIYFLEERMGNSGTHFLTEKNDESVMDLKMTIERLKYDNNEKTELLQDARFAIEDLESQVHSLTERREKESFKLKERVACLESELKDSKKPPSGIRVVESSPNASYVNSPAHKRILSSGEELGDSDDSLLREVEIEMRRKINFEGPQNLSVVHEQQEEVLGREIELEDRLDHLNSVIKETEKTLKNAQNDLSSRLREIESLQSRLKDRDFQINELEAKMEHLTRIDAEKEAEIRDLLYKREETLELLDKAKSDLEAEALKYDKGLRRKERIIKESDNEYPTQNDFGLSCVLTPSSPSKDTPGNKWGLDVVTQSLHIPPSNNTKSPSHRSWEVKKLREDIRILRDYLKHRVQEKKSLLEKISSLNKRVVVRSGRVTALNCEVVSVSCQTDESNLLQRGSSSLRSRLYALSDSLSRGKRSSGDFERIAGELRSLADEREFISASSSSSEWNTDLPDPSLHLSRSRLYSFCNNNPEDDHFSFVSMLEQFHPTEPEVQNVLEEDELLGAAFHSEDSWSQPDVSEARHRMGIPPLAAATTTGSELAGNANNSHNNNNTVPKLLGLTHESKESDLNELSQRTTSDQDCIMGNCLRDSLHRLKSLMDALSYEIDSTQEIESEPPTSDQGEEGERSKRTSSTPKRSPLQVCYSCSTRLSQDLQNHLLSANSIIQASLASLSRLRAIIQGHDARSRKSRSELNYTLSALSSLEASLLDSQDKAQETRETLDARLKELEGKNKENQNLKTKLNENYNLLAQLSSENLSLSKEKMKLEESLNSRLVLSHSNLNNNSGESPEQLRRQQQQQYYPLDKMNSSYRPLSNDCNGSWSIQTKQDNRHSSNLTQRSSPDTSSSFDFLPVDLRSKPQATPIDNTQFLPLTPPPQRLGGNRFGSRSSLRSKKYRNSCVISEAEEARLPSKEAGKHFRSIGNLSGCASDISSPDLGVDMSSSDPFSSLERRCLPNSEALNSVIHENYQLRRENKLLVEKLTGGKSSFKDTMD